MVSSWLLLGEQEEEEEMKVIWSQLPLHSLPSIKWTLLLFWLKGSPLLLPYKPDWKKRRSQQTRSFSCLFTVLTADFLASPSQSPIVLLQQPARGGSGLLSSQKPFQPPTLSPLLIFLVFLCSALANVLCVASFILMRLYHILLR